MWTARARCRTMCRGASDRLIKKRFFGEPFGDVFKRSAKNRRPTRDGGSEHRQSRCSAIESQLKQSFDGLHQFLVKWRFRPAGPKPLIFRPEIDIGSKFHLLLGDVHAAACGIKSKGLRALRCIPGFDDGLNRCPMWDGGFLRFFMLMLSPAV